MEKKNDKKVVETVVEEVVEKKEKKVKKEKVSAEEFRGIPLAKLRNHPRLHEPFLSRYGEVEAAKWFD